MFVVTVTFSIDSAHLTPFMLAMKQQATDSLEKEPECEVFDICVDPKNPCHIFLYEVYRSPEDFDAHLASAHFLQFNQKTLPWVVEKTVKTFYHVT